MAKTGNAISPARSADYAAWYQEAVRAADLAENAPVRGCMVIKPWGYALWENIQAILDGMLKQTGHRNAYFPLLIPLSYLEKEAEHVDGFAKECAVVTHHRLVKDAGGGLVPDKDAILPEPYIIRPTSETIIGAVFASWVQTHRDLPLLINQWANVLRWEMRTRLFLRTIEFLWQEGHTVHETSDDALAETLKILKLYTDFVQNYLAIPVVSGVKSPSERFAGAVETYSIEAMMGDRKALQAGTSQFLGQNFARASGIQFRNRTGAAEFGWTTSWGVSTRLIGAIVMTHGDDNGIVLPPRITPMHVVILPVMRGDDADAVVFEYADSVAAQLRDATFDGRSILVEIDKREAGGGHKQWDWIKKGVPIRIEVGPRDIEHDAVTLFRRDEETRRSKKVARPELASLVVATLDEIQKGCFDRALAHRDTNTRHISKKSDFVEFFELPKSGNREIYGGFALSPWCGSPACEEWAKTTLKVTIRCIPEETSADRREPCVVCGQPGAAVPLFARSY